MEVWLLKSAMAMWIDGICMGKIRERERAQLPNVLGRKIGARKALVYPKIYGRIPLFQMRFFLGKISN